MATGYTQLELDTLLAILDETAPQPPSKLDKLEAPRVTALRIAITDKGAFLNLETKGGETGLYHIDAKGETASLTNFMALDDARACEHALALMAESRWPGAEVWERLRRVHCAGVGRFAMGPPESGDSAQAPSSLPCPN